MLDDRDRRLLALLQENAETNVADLAERLHLSPSACSRRIGRLKADGYIAGSKALLDRQKINLPTTVFVLVRTGTHSTDWLGKFHAAISSIPEIVEAHRVTGNLDYVLKLVLPTVEYYDTVYKRLVDQIEMHDMSAFISMETVKLSSGLPLNHI